MKAFKESVKKELNYFIGKRYTLQYIIDYLGYNLSCLKIQTNKVKVKNLIDDEDYRIDFVIYFENCEVEGSIWYLKTRTSKLYITEFNID